MTGIILLTLTLIIFASLFLFLIAHAVSNRNYGRLFYVIPIALISSAMTIVTVQDIRGWPALGLPKKFMLLDYRTNGSKIWVWAIEEGRSTPRTYSIPYSSEMHKQLEDGKKMVKDGKVAMMEEEVGQELGIGDREKHKFKMIQPTYPEKQ